jgi:hypothetical protein
MRRISAICTQKNIQLHSLWDEYGPLRTAVNRAVVLKTERLKPGQSTPPPHLKAKIAKEVYDQLAAKQSEPSRGSPDLGIGSYRSRHSLERESGPDFGPLHLSPASEGILPTTESDADQVPGENCNDLADYGSPDRDSSPAEELSSPPSSTEQRDPSVPIMALQEHQASASPATTATASPTREIPEVRDSMETPSVAPKKRKRSSFSATTENAKRQRLAYLETNLPKAAREQMSQAGHLASGIDAARAAKAKATQAVATLEI